MKATLEFLLPEDDYDFRCAVKATELAGALFVLDAEIRNKLKHAEVDATTRQWLEQCRQQINEALQGIEP